nr:hypothetical protein [Tanacetum cinerariifolium]
MREVLGSSLTVGVFLQERKKEWGLSPKAKVRVLHTAQLDVTQAKKSFMAIDQTLCLFGSQSHPLIILETCGISSLALLGYGGSGDEYGSLPSDFGGLLLGKKGGK